MKLNWYEIKSSQIWNTSKQTFSAAWKKACTSKKFVSTIKKKKQTNKIIVEVTSIRSLRYQIKKKFEQNPSKRQRLELDVDGHIFEMKTRKQLIYQFCRKRLNFLLNVSPFAEDANGRVTLDMMPAQSKVKQWLKW